MRKLLWTGLALPFAGALVAMLRDLRAASPPVSVAIPPDLPVGLSVLGGVIMHRGEHGSLSAYSSRCTHLGCRIDRIIGGEAVCPCHGSRYRHDGTVSSGPATRPLTQLRVEPDAATGGWIARPS